MVLVLYIWLKTCMIIKSQHTLRKSLLELQEKKQFHKTCILLFSLISKHASYAQKVNKGIKELSLYEILTDIVFSSFWPFQFLIIHI